MLELGVFPQPMLVALHIENGGLSCVGAGDNLVVRFDDAKGEIVLDSCPRISKVKIVSFQSTGAPHHDHEQNTYTWDAGWPYGYPICVLANRRLLEVWDGSAHGESVAIPSASRIVLTFRSLRDNTTSDAVARGCSEFRVRGFSRLVLHLELEGAEVSGVPSDVSGV